MRTRTRVVRATTRAAQHDGGRVKVRMRLVGPSRGGTRGDRRGGRRGGRSGGTRVGTRRRRQSRVCGPRTPARGLRACRMTRLCRGRRTQCACPARTRARTTATWRVGARCSAGRALARLRRRPPLLQPLPRTCMLPRRRWRNRRAAGQRHVRWRSPRPLGMGRRRPSRARRPSRRRSPQRSVGRRSGRSSVRRGQRRRAAGGRRVAVQSERPPSSGRLAPLSMVCTGRAQGPRRQGPPSKADAPVTGRSSPSVRRHGRATARRPASRRHASTAAALPHRRPSCRPAPLQMAATAKPRGACPHGLRERRASAKPNTGTDSQWARASSPLDCHALYPLRLPSQMHDDERLFAAGAPQDTTWHCHKQGLPRRRVVVDYHVYGTHIEGRRPLQLSRSGVTQPHRP